MRLSIVFAVAVGLTLAVGCRGERAVAGGTRGVLRDSSGRELREVRLQVFITGETTPLGFAETDGNGLFAFYQPDARGALHLPAGDYVVTLESASPELPHIPAEYASPTRSPMRFSWTAGAELLELQGP